MTDTRLRAMQARTRSDRARTRTTLRSPRRDGRCKAVAMRRLPRMVSAEARSAEGVGFRQLRRLRLAQPISSSVQRQRGRPVQAQPTFGTTASLPCNVASYGLNHCTAPRRPLATHLLIAPPAPRL
ncbi:hypothetical protein CDO09_15160 [Xanthomonas perforans]|nr:hypothetical protein CDO09_15160 [Xanthomonas perforans]